MRNLGMLLGAVGGEMQIRMLSRDDVDTVICAKRSNGKLRICAGAVSTGENKSLIVLYRFTGNLCGGRRHYPLHVRQITSVNPRLKRRTIVKYQKGK